MSSPSSNITRTNEEFILAKYRKTSDVAEIPGMWTLRNCEIPKLTPGVEGEYIVESLYLSVDPYLSSTLNGGPGAQPLNVVQSSLGIARVLESTNSKFPVGLIFYGNIPWRRFSLLTAVPMMFKAIESPGSPSILGSAPLSSAVSLMPNQTAYYGVKHVLELKSDDIIVCSGAAGAVGTMVCQIAKNVIGAKRVIGIAGSNEKCEYLKTIGCDAAFNYKLFENPKSLAAKISEAAGGPITKYFDNVGGISTDAVFEILGRHSIVAVCGQIAAYGPGNPNRFPNYLMQTIYRAIRIQGFVVSDYLSLNEKEFFVDFPQWISEGKIRTFDTVLEGMAELPVAFQRLFTGESTGKLLVKL